jgi:hypothetical protein
VVVGNAPGWTDPWSRAQLVHVRKAEHSWGKYLVDENGHLIDKQDVQRARRPAPLG